MSVTRNPYPVFFFNFSFSVLRSPFSGLRSPFSGLRSPFSVLRSPFSVLRFPRLRSATGLRSPAPLTAVQYARFFQVMLTGKFNRKKFIAVIRLPGFYYTSVQKQFNQLKDRYLSHFYPYPSFSRKWESSGPCLVSCLRRNERERK